MEENEQVLESSSQDTPVQPQQTQQSDADKNFAALRQARQKAERERDEANQRLAQYEAQQKPQEPVRNRNNDDLAEWGDIQKVKQELDSKLQEINLRTTHPDIYQVVSKDNIDKLREADPELAQMIYEEQFKDPSKAMKLAYKFIKKLNIQPEKDYSKENDLIESNQAKPKSSASATRATPLSQANEYMASSYKEQQAHKTRVFLEMQEAAANKY